MKGRLIFSILWLELTVLVSAQVSQEYIELWSDPEIIDKMDALGFQCHFFHGEKEYQDVLNGKFMQPKVIYDILDTYTDFDRPIHITEITIPTLPNNEIGEQAQATVTENLYKIWFSHPAVEAITWWNIVDGTAAGNEDRWYGGMLRNDFSPKSAFHVLDRLINSKWKTKTTGQTDKSGRFNLRGFYGPYSVIIKYKNKTKPNNLIST